MSPAPKAKADANQTAVFQDDLRPPINQDLAMIIASIKRGRVENSEKEEESDQPQSAAAVQNENVNDQGSPAEAASPTSTTMDQSDDGLLHLQRTTEIESMLERQVGKTVLHGLDDVGPTLLYCLSSGRNSRARSGHEPEKNDSGLYAMVISDSPSSESSVVVRKRARGNSVLARRAPSKTTAAQRTSSSKKETKRLPKKSSSSAARKTKPAAPRSRKSTADKIASKQFHVHTDDWDKDHPNAPVPWPASNVLIKKIHDHDVLCGRGNGIYKWPGNQRYREFVMARKKDYISAYRTGKTDIALNIIRSIKALEPPGRFVERCNPDGVGSKWREISFEKAMEKTAQALREGAAQLRREYGVKLWD